MRLALILNRAAGSFRHLPADVMGQQITHLLQQAGHQVEQIITGRHDLAGHLSTAAHRADLEAVIVGGGDGTIQTAILAGLGQVKPLGILPLGTLNLLARDLHLPTDPLVAAQQIANGRVVAIDLAEVNGEPFAIWASLGLHPLIVRRRDRLQKEGLRKWPAFIVAALRAFRRYPLIRVTLSSGSGNSITVTTPLLVISNNPWQEQTPPLVRESLDQGVLVVHVAKTTSRLGMIWLAVQALFGLWKTSRLMQSFTAEEVRVISRKRRVMVSLDGEVTVMRSPLTFKINKKKLNMLMPFFEAKE